MADAGAIGTYSGMEKTHLLSVWANNNIQSAPVMPLNKPLEAVNVLSVWAAGNIQATPVMPLNKQLEAVRILPVWAWSGSNDRALNIPVNGTIDGYLYGTNGSPLAYGFVRLYLVDTGALIYQKKTDAGGYYAFINLDPSSHYIVMAVTSAVASVATVMAIGQIQPA